MPRRRSVGARLAAAFAVNVAILIGLLFFHTGTIRESVRAGQELAETSARLHASANETVAWIDQLQETLSKYVVTADSGYLEKFAQLSSAFATSFDQLAAQPLDPRERTALNGMNEAWQQFDARARSLGSTGIEPASLADSARVLGALITVLYQRAGSLEAASQSVLTDRLASSAASAARAERVSWAAAALALLLSILVPGVFVRSISRDLHALQAGTRAVARGDFEHRLPDGSTREFAQLASDFNTMTHRLGELDAMQREFLSRVSHDLKTPLASMRETVNALLDEVVAPLSPQQRTLLQLNHESGERLAAMIAKLLNLSALEAGTPAVLATHDVGALARAAVGAAAVSGRERNIGVHIHADDHALVRCDAERLRQLLDNLLENALKFSPRGGNVRVRVCAGEDVVVTVSDEGPGVPADARERIFERFYQTKQGRSVPGRGVGLGLTICREIAHLHGGTISADSCAGGGAEFRVSLPAAGVSAARPVQAEALV